MKPVKTVIFLAIVGTSAAAQQQPLSAIDWLNNVVTVPIAHPRQNTGEPAVTETAVSPDVDVRPLDGAVADAVGLLPSGTTGLPVSIWTASDTQDLVSELARLSPEPLPAIQALYYTLLLAEADPPADAGPDAPFLRARIDTLIAFGAVEPAKALLERAGPQTPVLFDKWLDLSLLEGTEGVPCKTLRERPVLSQSYAARIYCTARTGDWPTAALLYETSVGLGVLSPVEELLLAFYLDPETIEIEEPPAPPKTVTPMIFRLFEAAGTPLPTRSLPRAFATLDLRDTAGWRAEIEAAERLTRTGALPGNRLLGLYTNRKPAASGGVWDRVRAVQAFDAALRSGKPGEVATTLPAAWQAMRDRGLKKTFAQLFADRLRGLDLPPDAADIAFQINLLTDEYEIAGEMLEAPDDNQKFLIGLAQGMPDPALARTGREEAIARAFGAAAPAGDYADLVRVGKLGEAILVAAGKLDQSRNGNLSEMTDSLMTLRSFGLEDTARRTALQLLIFEAS